MNLFVFNMWMIEWIRSLCDLIRKCKAKDLRAVINSCRKYKELKRVVSLDTLQVGLHVISKNLLMVLLHLT
jgi:hypothetical protein